MEPEGLSDLLWLKYTYSIASSTHKRRAGTASSCFYLLLPKSLFAKDYQEAASPDTTQAVSGSQQASLPTSLRLDLMHIHCCPPLVMPP